MVGWGKKSKMGRGGGNDRRKVKVGRKNKEG